MKRNLDKLIYLHLFMFVAFVFLLLAPLFLETFLQYTLLAKKLSEVSLYLMWGIWFPLVFISVIFTGRSWCGIFCPMGAASEWANKVGKQRAIPAWMRWEGTPIISFILVTTLGQTLSVRDFVDSMAVLFGGTLICAIFVGYFYGKKKRVWCRHMCPIGLLLGVFSRLSILQLHPKSPLPGESRYVEKGPCPTMIDIPRKQESRHCIECFRCVHPDKNKGLKLVLQRPGLEVEKIRHFNPNNSEMWFLFLGSGSALGGFLWLTLSFYQVLRDLVGTWFIENEYYWIGESGPSWLMSVHPDSREVFNWLDFIMITSFMTLVMFFVAGVMYFFTLLSSLLADKAGAIGTQKEQMIQLSYQFMPVALVSLLLGLGGDLFMSLMALGFELGTVEKIKYSVFIFAIFWSVFLSYKILLGMRVKKSNVWMPIFPGVLGSVFVSGCWWAAIF
ncbi:4Fe-4S binding protein [Aliikangiella sp. IMCC44359]|uniref:4Fe-4S binding protein n=1 Tax=Aliikangiella sp. IMCC44359 TaxID=3459125 RepID=UPI00403B0C9D